MSSLNSASWFANQPSGFEKIPRNEVIRNPSLTTEEKAILAVLSSYKPSYPSIKQIQRDTALSRTAVFRWLKSLKDQNVIEWIRGTSHGLNNEYTIKPYSQWRLVPKKDKYGSRSKRRAVPSTKAESPLSTSSSPQCETPNIPIINSTNRKGPDSEPLSINHKLNEVDTNQPEVRNADLSSDATVSSNQFKGQPRFKTSNGRITKDQANWRLKQIEVEIQTSGSDLDLQREKGLMEFYIAKMEKESLVECEFYEFLGRRK